MHRPDPLVELARQLRTDPPPHALRVLALTLAGCAHVVGLAVLLGGLTGAFA